jgi:hypothetical protein
LHFRTHGRAIFDLDFSVVAAGFGDDGGVDGVNRRLNMMRQIADADRDRNGAIIYRFFGVLDNDRAGRNALQAACTFDRRLIAYRDIMLLHPVMPVLANASADLRHEILQANRQFSRLDWEIEDLCSQRLLAEFEVANPRAITARQIVGGRIHREFDRRSKPELKRYFIREADIEDAREMLVLLKALRSYVGLPHEFI